MRRMAAVPAGGEIDWVTYYFRDRRLAHALLDAREIAERLLPRGQWQPPAVVVIDLERIVELLGAVEQELPFAQRRQQEDVVEEGDMAQFPAEGVHRLQQRHGELFVVKIGNELERVLARLPDEAAKFLSGKYQRRLHGCLLSGGTTLA